MGILKLSLVLKYSFIIHLKLFMSICNKFFLLGSQDFRNYLDNCFYNNLNLSIVIYFIFLILLTSFFTIYIWA